MKKKPQPKRSKQEIEKKKLYDAMDSIMKSIRQTLKHQFAYSQGGQFENPLLRMIKEVDDLHEILSDLFWVGFTPGEVLRGLKKKAA